MTRRRKKTTISEQNDDSLYINLKIEWIKFACSIYAIEFIRFNAQRIKQNFVQLPCGKQQTHQTNEWWEKTKTNESIEKNKEDKLL